MAEAGRAANTAVPQRPPMAVVPAHTRADRMPPATTEEEDRVADGVGSVVVHVAVDRRHAGNVGVKPRDIVAMAAVVEAVEIGGGDAGAGAADAAIGLPAVDHPVACVAGHR